MQMGRLYGRSDGDTKICNPDNAVRPGLQNIGRTFLGECSLKVSTGWKTTSLAIDTCSPRASDANKDTNIAKDHAFSIPYKNGMAFRSPMATISSASCFKSIFESILVLISSAPRAFGAFLAERTIRAVTVLIASVSPVMGDRQMHDNFVETYPSPIMVTKV